MYLKSKMSIKSFPMLLRLEPEWGVGTRYLTTYWPWLALHFHTNNDEDVGYMMDGKCPYCDELFPETVVGMYNMMNGLRGADNDKTQA